THDGRVAGVRGKGRTTATVTEMARVVIGADGTDSTIAGMVQAPQHTTRPRLQGTYFTYWSGVAIEGIEYSVREHRAAYGWLTNDGLALVGVNWTARDFQGVGADIERNYLETLALCLPSLAERVQLGKREGRWIGGAVDTFFRQSHGPGWALVGDAGYTKDFCTAQGISDAFRDSETLAEALDDGLSGRRPLDTALEDYERRRNDVALPFYDFTCQLAP